MLLFEDATAEAFKENLIDSTFDRNSGKKCDIILPASDNPNCPVCRSNSWVLSETTMSEKEYFKRLLKDPHGTIGYHLVKEMR